MIRDTYKYHLKIGENTVWRDVTSNLKRREIEHQVRYGSEAHVIQIGCRVTRKGGLRWLHHEEDN